MNRKGRIGDFIASMTVLFGVIIVMLLFSAFSLGLFGANIVKDKLKESTTSEMKLQGSNPLFDYILVDGDGMTLLAGFRLSVEENIIEDEKFTLAVNDLVPDKGCIILLRAFTGKYSGDLPHSVIGYLFSKENGYVAEAIDTDLRFNKKFKVYQDLNSLSEITISYLENLNNNGELDAYDDSITYYSYRGECLHE